jgi:hypothetical protein
MRTKLTIVSIVLACIATGTAVFVGSILWFGWFGGVVVVGLAMASLFVYLRMIRPWHSRWGATDAEVGRPLPGDELIPDAASTTRAISIEAAPEQVWPWLLQIGYGRAGWYSYDWIDNDGRPSAMEVIPELQTVHVGDTIEMVPGFGPKIIDLYPPMYLIAGDKESGTWCLFTYMTPNGCRLISRWRQAWQANGLASRFFIMLSDPGAFIMERKMLLGLKKRAEAAQRTVGEDEAGSKERGVA